MTDPVLALLCPNCRAQLPGEATASGFACPSCATAYPCPDGIPRLLPAKFDKTVLARYERAGADDLSDTKSVGYQFARQHDIMIAAVAAELDSLPPGATILDIGCGNGHFSRDFASVHNLVGVDLAHQMLRRARANGLQPFQADAQVLPFADSQFDAVLSTEMIQHFDTLDRFAREVARVLRPQGRAIVTTIHRRSAMRRLQRMVRGNQGRPRLRSAAEVAQPFEAVGTRLDHVRWTHFPLPYHAVSRATGYPLAWLATNVIACFRKG